MDKIEIISTLGPASINKNCIRMMDKSGVDIFRINMSHTSVDEFENYTIRFLSGQINLSVLIKRDHSLEQANYIIKKIQLR